MVTPLSDIANFWSSVATLMGASGAWFTYYGAVVSNRDDRYQAVCALISGLKTELLLIGDWASGGEDDQGYLQFKSPAELVNEYPAWHNPSRVIFSFGRFTKN